MAKLDIKSYTLDALQDLMCGMGEPKFRAKQIFAWLHEKQVETFDEMTTLAKPLRERLAEECYINGIAIKKKQVSALDGTVKYLFELKDGSTIESVLMHYKHGQSLCISTQVGCRMGCGFCASTLGGLVRNLTPAEMLDQIYMAGKDSGAKISNVVLMGIGEPLDNFENVLDFLTILAHPAGLNLSLRHVSLSTCGLADKIDALAAKKLPLTLSVSLHAPNDAIRAQMMPINAKWDVDKLLAACKRYFDETGRRISFEYALVGGVNDSTLCAKQLANKLKPLNCHVNLIPVNEVAERGYKRSGAETITAFQRILECAGITATVRRELGRDISAACGQLRREAAVSGS